jgi:ankyrin repeat protein
LHIVRLLLERGADPNLPEECAPSGSALYDACAGNHQEMAELLLAHGADANAGYDSCECCLTIGTIYHGERARPLQEILRKHGAYTPPYYMNASQMKQAIRDDDQVLRHEEFLGNLLAKRDGKLLEMYLDWDPTAIERMHHHAGAVYPRSPALMRLLLSRGMDPNRPDWTGKTFLHAAAENGDRAVAAILLEAGADLHHRELEFRSTPLAAAVRACPIESDSHEGKRSRQMIRFLLARGAKPNLPDDDPWSTPMAWASARSLADVEELLRKNGAT